MRFIVIAAAVIGGLALVGCGGSSGGTTTVVTVVKEQPADGSAKGDAERTATTESAVSDDDTGGGSSGDKITVPDEVGKNHQAAQDDLQAHGLYNLSEEDATGRGRMLILDRNWKVVSQDPPAGTRVHEDATVTLRSKKYTDP